MTHISKGFSLIELMVTVTIIAIIGSVALPSYFEHVELSRIPEATSTLSELAFKMEQGYQNSLTDRATTNNNSYQYDCTVLPAADPQTGEINGENFDYTCAGTGTQAFTITAEGKDVMDGYQFRINESGAQQTLEFPGSTTINANNPLNCWIRKKSETCP